MKRSWGATEQKIVAAQQSWCCKLCSCLLPASFELDHILPLCDGGLDDWTTNAQALCPTCHASKTQRENLERRTRARAAVAAAKTAAQEKHKSALPTGFRLPSQHCQRASKQATKRATDFSDNPFAQFAYMPGI